MWVLSGRKPEHPISFSSFCDLLVSLMRPQSCQLPDLVPLQAARSRPPSGRVRKASVCNRSGRSRLSLSRVSVARSEKSWQWEGRCNADLKVEDRHLLEPINAGTRSDIRGLHSRDPIRSMHNELGVASVCNQHRKRGR